MPVPLSEDGWLVLLLDDGSQSLSVALLSLASLNVVQELVVPEKRGRTRQRQPTVADLDGDGVYEAVFGTGSGRIYAVSLDPAEMKVKKTWMADAAVEGELAIGEFGPGGEPLLVAVDVQGKVYGFEMRTESRKWIVELRGRSSQDIVAYYDERVGRWSLFVVYEAGRVCRIDLSTGEILRQWKFGTRIMSAVTPFQMTRDVVGFAFCGKDGIRNFGLFSHVYEIYLF